MWLEFQFKVSGGCRCQMYERSRQTPHRDSTENCQLMCTTNQWGEQPYKSFITLLNWTPGSQGLPQHCSPLLITVLTFRENGSHISGRYMYTSHLDITTNGWSPLLATASVHSTFYLSHARGKDSDLISHLVNLTFINTKNIQYDILNCPPPNTYCLWQDTSSVVKGKKAAKAVEEDNCLPRH